MGASGTLSQRAHLIPLHSFALLALSFLLLSGHLTPAMAAGPTLVYDDIVGEITWTEAESPYIVARDVAVDQGAVLTVAPGAVVLFQRVDAPKTWTRGTVLRVRGTLKSVGTAARPIRFSLQESQDIGGWGGIWIDGFFGGRAEITFTRVEYAERGVYVSNAPVSVTDSVFSENLTGLHIENAEGVTLEGNNLSRNQYGLYVDGAGGSVKENTVVSNTWGIYVFNGAGLDIHRNDIKSNTFGIVYDGGENDVVSYNDFSIRNTNDYVMLIRNGKPHSIDHNNFYFDPEILNDPSAVFWYIFNEANNDRVAAPNNYWNSTEPHFIDTFIFDERDDAFVGLIDYEPFETGPVSGTIDDTRPPQVHILSRVTFSPDGDTKFDEARIPYSLSEDAESLVVAILDTSGLMGAVGSVIWEETYVAGGIDADDDLVRDGSHTVVWDGTVEATGETVLEGVYTVRIHAYDRVNTDTSGEATRDILADLSPPVLEIASPADGDVSTVALVTITGQASDVDTAGLSVTVAGEEATLSAGQDEWTNFEGEAVLLDNPHVITVQATDGSGHTASVSLTLDFQPVLTIDIPSTTSMEVVAAKGDVRHTDVQSVRATVRDPFGNWSAPLTGDVTAGSVPTYATPQSLVLSRGLNLVLVEGLDGGDGVVGSVAAWVTHNPFADQTLEHTFSSGLKMITVPMTPDTTDAGAALGISGDLPLARWQSTSQGPQYVKDGDSGFQSFAPGRGYWMDLSETTYPSGHHATLEGTVADTTTDAEIPLQAGWNQVGNPFLKSVDWESVSVRLPGGQPVTWKSAVQNGWLRSSLWGYDGSGYRMASTLNPWEGYWVKAGRDLTLLVTPPDLSMQSMMAPLGVYLAGGQEREGWALRLGVRSELGNDGENMTGVSPQASERFDVFYDVEEPPSAGDVPRLYVSNDDQGPLAVDMRGPAEGPGYRWPVRLETPSEGAYEIYWSGLDNLPPGSSAYFVDEAAGRQVNMARTSSVMFEAEAAGVYAMTVEVFADGELTLSNLLVYPNPTDLFSPVRIRFNLSARATIKAGVYDTGRRRVRRLPTQVGGPGPVTLSWDGRNSQGQVVANGLYFVTIYIDGGQRSQRHVARVAVLK